MLSYIVPRCTVTLCIACFTCPMIYVVGFWGMIYWLGILLFVEDTISKQRGVTLFVYIYIYIYIYILKDISIMYMNLYCLCVLFENASSYVYVSSLQGHCILGLWLSLQGHCILGL